METRGRVTLVDRHAAFVQVVAGVLEREGYRCRHVDATDLSPRALARAVARTRPDLVLAGLNIEAGGGTTVIEQLTDLGIAVVVTSDGSSPARLDRALAAGAGAVVPQDVTLDRFLTLVRDAMGGARQQQAWPADVPADPVAELTRQERDLLAHLMEGRTAAEVARLRHVSEGTVRSQAKAVMTKLGVSSQLTAVAVAWRHGHDPSSLHAADR